MSFMSVITRPENKKYVIACVVIFSAVIVTLIAVAVTIGNGEGFVLDESPLIDGRNNLAQTIHDLAKNSLQKFDFASNLTNDSLWGKQNCSFCATDLVHLKRGKVAAQFWVADVDCKTQYKDAVSKGLEQIDVIKRFIRKYSQYLEFVTSAEGIMDAFNNEKIGSLIALGGGVAIDSRLALLRVYYDLGVRYITLTTECSTPWIAGSLNKKVMFSLTTFGEEVIHEMNRLGLMIDLSGVDPVAIKRVLEISQAPVIFSHSAANKLCNHFNNIPDSLFELVKNNSALIMITFDSVYLCSLFETPTIHNVIDHINYIVNKTGVDHVGIGANFNSIYKKPRELEDVSKYPLLFEKLKLLDSTRWNNENLKKLAGLNLIRVFRAVEEVRNNLRNFPAYEDWISKDELNNVNDMTIWTCRTE